MQIGLSEATVLMRKISSFGDPRLYALQQVVAELATSKQPLVPERLFVSSSADGESSGTNSGMLGTLLQLLVAEKSGFAFNTNAQPEDLASMNQAADQLSKKAMESMLDTLGADDARYKFLIRQALLLTLR